MLIRTVRTFILVLLVLLFGCQSPLWESLKQSTEQENQRIAIQQAFESAGLTWQSPTPGESNPRYRCKTRYFEIIFPAEDAGLALHLASQADSIYRMMKAWFGYGLPYDIVSVRIYKRDGEVRFHENMTGGYRGIRLREGTRPSYRIALSFLLFLHHHYGEGLFEIYSSKLSMAPAHLYEFQ